MDPRIARAYAQWSALLDDMAHEHVPASVRAAFADFLDEWRGEDAPLEARWKEAYRAKVASSEHAALDMALYLASAPYRITEQHVQRFREYDPKPVVLLCSAAWASFTAARKIGSWL